MKAEDLRMALQELEVLRLREASALRDSRATFAVLDALITCKVMDDAILALLEVVAREFDAPTAILCRADPGGGLVRFLRQLPGCTLSDDHILMRQGFTDRPRRMMDLSVLAAPGALDPMRSAIMVPLPLHEEPGLAILCLSERAEHFQHSDLIRLMQMARVASQPLATLRLTRRNADLAALISGAPHPGPDEAGTGQDGFDQPFRAINSVVDKLTRGQGLVVSILNRLLTATDEELDQQIALALGEVGRFGALDRIYVFQLDDTNLASNTFEWVAEGIPSVKYLSQNLPVEMFPNWYPQLLSGLDVHVTNSNDLPDHMPEKAFMLQQGIKSLVMAPIVDHGRLEGVVGYDAVGAVRAFLQGEIFLLRSIANAIGAMLRKRNSTRKSQQAQHALDLERARLKATLAALPDLVIELDESGRFTEHYSQANKGMAQIAGNLIGRTLHEIVPPYIAETGHRMLAEVAQSGRTDAFTFRHDIGGGSFRWIRAKAARREPTAADGTPGFLFLLRDVTKEVEQAREIALLGEVAMRTSNLVIVTDERGRITWVNESFETVSGWQRDEVIGKMPDEFLQPPDVDMATVARIRDALDAGRPVKAELSNIARNGRRYWVSMDMQPLRDADGEVTGFVTVQNDITDAKLQAGALAAAAEAARRSRSQLIAAVEALEDGFVYFDNTGRMVVCNERYRTITTGFEDMLVPGVTPDEIFRRGLELGLYDDAIGREDEWLAHRMAKHKHGELTLEQRLTDGRWMRVFDKMTPDGGRVGLRVDITALKEAEARALADRAAAMDAAHDGMAITAPDGTFIYANPAFQDLVRSPQEATLLGKHWHQTFGPELRADLESRAMTALTDLGDRWRGVVEWCPPGRLQVDMEVSLSRRGDGALVWVLRDLTERRAAEGERDRLRDALQTAQRREVIGQLAAGLAHDFNNLIAAISGSAALILDDAGDNRMDRAKDHALRIHKSAERAEVMVRRLLALGARPASQQQTDLVPVLHEAADLLRPGLGRTISLSLDLPNTPMMTSLGTTDVLQIVLNLGINARDAMLQAPRPGGGNKISLSLRPATPEDMAVSGGGQFRLGVPDASRPHVCLIMSDTGPGIPCHQAESIFAPYFSTKGEKGSGLGLSIVAGLIKAAGGSIELGIAETGGAKFTVLLPLADPNGADPAPGPLFATAAATAEPVPAPAQTPAPAPGRSLPLQGRSILIVDDAEDVLVVLAALLERAGAEVAPTSDAQAAFEVLREDADAFDLVITDFDMGQLTGADLSRAAHQVRPDLPVILVTALPDWRQRDPAGLPDPAFFSVLGKPVSAETLVGAALNAIGSLHN